MVRPDFYNLRRLFHFRQLLEGLNPDHPPRAIIIEGSQDLSLARIGVLSGSFNPPTLAHVELARQAKKSFQLSRILFTVARVTVDKERAEGLSLEDRLLLLSLIAEEMGSASVAAVNRGLYFEQAKAFRSLLGNKARIYFVVGMDKVIQIFDLRYYQDRDAALGNLFTEAQLVAASRGPWGGEELKHLLDRIENRPYQDRVYPLTLSEEMRGVSSTTLRTMIVKGECVEGQLPAVVERFVLENDAYRPRYEYRSLLLDRLYAVREWAEEMCDYEGLVEIAGEDSARGENLREILRSDEISLSRLKDTITALLRARRG
ncbi:MAG: nicotinate-nicotinamide nucleotide adenylyltransferase [Candidatus Binatia bacterium]